MACCQSYGHALLVGAPHKTLHGVENDVRSMAELLRGRGFEVETCTGDQATRAGILAAYDRLIHQIQRCSKARPDEPAVFYYAGHGFRAFDEKEARSWKGISPVDLVDPKDSTITDFRGVTSWELSIKQAQLAQATRNVTVILDCCYASQMSRDGVARSAHQRALPHPLRVGFAAHLEVLRATYGTVLDAVHPTGEPNAVRLVACGAEQCAHEYQGEDGLYHGAFTAALVDVLREAQRDEVPVSWCAVDGAIRARVLRMFPIQRPGIEGPVRRRLFSLDEDSGDGAVPIVPALGGYRLGAGCLMGVAPCDVYGVMPPGPPTYRASEAIAEVRVCKVAATSAHATLSAWKNGHAAIPRHAIAVLAEKAAFRHAVAIDVPAHARNQVVDAIEATRTLRVAESGEATALPALRLRDGVLTISDRLGPLFPEAAFPHDLPGTVNNLANLGAAQRLRELEGEHGVSAGEVEIAWGTVDRGQMWPMPESGGALALQDRPCVKIRRTTERTLYAHIFNIGIRGTITWLTRYAASGVALTTQEPEHVLGRSFDGALSGLEIGWPVGMPRVEPPRIDEIVVIVTSKPANLQCLETSEHLARPRGAGSKLEELLAQLQHGHPRSTRGAEPIDAFYIKRLWYLLFPLDGAMADIPFQIDDNLLQQASACSPDAWLAPRAVPIDSPNPSHELTIRIADLVVEKRNRPGGRMDILICTRSIGEGGGHATWTYRYPSEVGNQLPDIDNCVVFRGPVRDFVSIFVWSSGDGDLDLFRQLVERVSGPQRNDAVGGLRYGAGGEGLPWITSLGASAVLSRAAFELLGGPGKAIGLYRGGFSAAEQFGRGSHPRDAIRLTEGISFKLLIEPV